MSSFSAASPNISAFFLAAGEYVYLVSSRSEVKVMYTYHVVIVLLL